MRSFVKMKTNIDLLVWLLLTKKQRLLFSCHKFRAVPEDLEDSEYQLESDRLEIVKPQGEIAL